MKKKETCLCLKCGGGFELALEENADMTKEKCPLCNGNNVIKYNPQDFFTKFFGGRVGGG